MIKTRKIAIITVPIILLLLIVCGTLINNQMKKDDISVEEERKFASIVTVVNDIDYTDIKEASGLSLSDNIKTRYDVYNSSDIVAYIYIASGNGLNGKFSISVSIIESDSSYSIHTICLYENDKNDENYASLVSANANFLSYFDDFSLTNEIDVDTVSGATITSSAIKELVNEIKAQVQVDFNIQFSSYTVTFVSKKQDYSTLYFVYTIKVENSKELTSETITITTDQLYNLVDNNPIMDDELTEKVKALISSNKFNKKGGTAATTDAYISSISEDGKTIVTVSKGYVGIVTVTYTINDGAIVSANVDISKEVALSGAGGTVNQTIADSMANGEIDAVSGATYTSSAILSTRLLVLDYLKEVK